MAVRVLEPDEVKWIVKAAVPDELGFDESPERVEVDSVNATVHEPVNAFESSPSRVAVRVKSKFTVGLWTDDARDIE